VSKEIEEFIDHLITRPAMWASSPAEFEGMVRGAIHCWDLTREGNSHALVRRYIREEAKPIYAEKGTEMPPPNIVISLATELWTVPTVEAMTLTATAWRNIWRKLTNPVDALGALVEEV